VFAEHFAAHRIAWSPPPSGVSGAISSSPAGAVGFGFAVEQPWIPDRSLSREPAAVTVSPRHI